MEASVEDILISVVMSVYNTNERYLREAIESILNQTHKNLEFVIIDDKSEPWCRKIIDSYTDKRIIVLSNETNIGLTASLNRGMKQATGKYIARMDSDDVSYKDRLSKQLSYMEKNQNIDISASIAALVHEGRIINYSGLYRKFDVEKIRIQMSFSNVPFVHPTVIFRKSFLEQNNLCYDETIKKAQDYNMWVRCLEYGTLSVLQEVLLDYRIHGEQISSEGDSQRDYSDMTKILCLEKIVPVYNKREKELYLHWKDTKLYGSSLENIEFIKKLICLNDQKGLYDRKKYKNELFFWWFRKSFFKENRVNTINMLQDSYVRKGVLIALKGEFVDYLLQKRYEDKIK